MPRRYLIAPDKFKGSLSAPDAAAAIAAGISQGEPDATLDLCPIADGGEGFMDTLAAALHGRWISCPAVDALGREITSRYVLAVTDDGPIAVMEMAETAGLWRLGPGERDPLAATTFGVGMQMAHAVSEHAVTRIILGIGGSATNDGGSGMAAALGVDFLTASGGKVRPTPSNLDDVCEVDMTRRIRLPEVIAACDVENPLLGPQGATAIFSAQKGSTSETRPQLETALAHLVTISDGEEAALTPGAGAAGGLGFGLLHFAGAELISGFDLLAGLLHLEERIRQADVVITGEGSIDHQSLSGKGPVALARLAGSHGVPVIGYCGIADDAARGSGVFHSLHALADGGLPFETLISQAGPLLTELVAGNPPL
ncbi:glycerate kinase [Luteolibacter yonseiensis]|uniref:Glycerate kinase n=1 Tax=Luteolibacter yonseiensis TaxID=1144680 RepID=A0A934VCF6_9BACT|nr:glycerate kinase [Luteolibacter yonseiensis]MBK1817115.1 glycerate kinase [Luteolibacter yonseiensis]